MAGQRPQGVHACAYTHTLTHTYTHSLFGCNSLFFMRILDLFSSPLQFRASLIQMLDVLKDLTEV